MKVRDAIRLVEAGRLAACKNDTGSHRHFKYEWKPNVVTIPGHPGDDLPKGTLKSILRAAGLETKQ